MARKRKLSDDVSRALLDSAWDRVRTRANSPGLDGIDLATFEADLNPNLDALWADLRSGAYRPQPYLGIDIPKTNGGHRRIVIATVRDRVVQTAATLALQPLIEPLLHEYSFAYRRGLGVQDALARVAACRDRGLVDVFGADIERFFDSVPHDRLFQMLDAAGIGEAWCNRLRQWIETPVQVQGVPMPAGVGLPQGLPISPLLANLYLTPFDRAMADEGHELTRYADDFVVCSADAAARERGEACARTALEHLGLGVADSKVFTGTFEAGFVFLGARFEGAQLIPATPHPYEADYSPPPPPPQTRKKPQPLQAPVHSLLRTLYIQEQGSRLGRHGARLVVSEDSKTLLDLPVHQVDQVFIFGQVQITTAAMGMCLMRNIPIYLFSGHGKYYGVLRSAEDPNFALHAAQFALAADTDRRLAFARAVVLGKVAHSLDLLEQHAHNHPDTDLHAPIGALRNAKARIPHVKKLDVLRGVEGAAAAAYFDGFSQCLRGAMGFARRVRRPPTDPVNSLLSFGYSILFYNIHSYLCARGLDPSVGLFHEPGQGHPALASDLVEEFRAPLVDALVLSLVNRGQVTPADFYFAEGTPQPCYLKDGSRPVFLRALEGKLADTVHHADTGHDVDWRRVIDLQVCRVRRFIEGKTDRYEAFKPA